MAVEIKRQREDPNGNVEANSNIIMTQPDDHEEPVYKSQDFIVKKRPVTQDKDLRISK